MDFRKSFCLFILLLQLLTFQPYPARSQQSVTNTNADSSITLSQTSITGRLISGRIVTIKYKTLSGNNPKKLKNWVGIWQSDQILYSDPPLRKKYITGTDKDGDLAFDSLEMQRKEYIIGYGVGDGNNTIAATLFIPTDAQPSDMGIAFATLVEVIEHGNNFLIVKFQTPLGNRPAANQNWIGVWDGKSFSTDGVNLIKREPVASQVSGHVVAINDLKLTRNTWYTITYSLGTQYRDIVASYTFLNN